MEGSKLSFFLPLLAALSSKAYKEQHILIRGAFREILRPLTSPGSSAREHWDQLKQALKLGHLLKSPPE